MLGPLASDTEMMESMTVRWNIWCLNLDKEVDVTVIEVTSKMGITSSGARKGLLPTPVQHPS
jgi:hypothetical protein